MSLRDLREMSNKYGSDAKYVLAGGGNTSFKDGNVIYVKGSGTALATITEDQFVALDRQALSAMLSKTYSKDDDAREEEALKDMMAARLPGEGGKRPSVETTLHNMLPFTYVLHVHPALVNGLTCGNDAEKLTEKLFGGKAVFIPITKPGYVLAVKCNEEMNKYREKNGSEPQLIILQNHGIFFAADTVAEIDAMVADTMMRLEAMLKRTPDFSEADYDEEKVSLMIPALRMHYGEGDMASATFVTNKEIKHLTASRAAMTPILSQFTPDHIVYCKARYLVLSDGDNIAEKFDAFVLETGYKPKIVLVEGEGIIVLGANKKEVETAKKLILDAITISVYAESFGGICHMTQEYVDFITNWETEKYRSKVSLASSNAKRIAEKIAIVTGSAQGFGKGIAKGMAKNGAFVVIADMNYEGAEACAAEIRAEYGEYAATAVAVNVADEDSVKNMLIRTVNTYGGIDVFVNNAGVARAGSLEEMDKKTFEFVTSINYTAYFICTKYASRYMKIQHEAAPSYAMDIIEINSKSGLSGSNKNFAYAGSKFGGVGLTQSFALELVPYNIKVNAVCPGNLLDGPLWSDPVRGLFVQYFNAGKVPGAKSVADVRKYYESKVPMGRGCHEEDVAIAILYIIEQKYETGQAIPVTGGQTMLK